MKYVLIFLFVFIYSTNFFSQTKVDSLIAKFDAAKTDLEKQDVIYEMVYLFYPKTTIHSKVMAMEFLNHVKKQNNESISDLTTLYIAYQLNMSGDYGNALQISLPVFDRSEARKDTLSMQFALDNISQAYINSKNYDKAINAQKKAVRLATIGGDKRVLAETYNVMGYIYAKASLPDSGLVYSQKAINVASESDNKDLLRYIYDTTADNYIANKDYDLAIPFLRKSLRLFLKDSTYDTSVGYVYNNLSESFLGAKIYDSSYYYAQKAIAFCKPIDMRDQLLESYEFNHKIFEAINQPDSTYKYYRLATILKDSLFDLEKIKSIESISFQEQLKEQEKELALTKAEEERQHTIQFALLAVGILSFIIVFLLLSRSMITSTRLIKFLSVVALLMVFEFLNLILHPFLEKVTHHSPILMLLSLVCIAALLVPLHHKIEHWATHKLVEKNKQIRLAAAKKTIEQLEANAEH